MLAGYDTFGQTGNQLRAMYRDVEYARNNDMSLGLMRDFWAMATVPKYFMADGEDKDKEP